MKLYFFKTEVWVRSVLSQTSDHVIHHTESSGLCISLYDARFCYDCVSVYVELIQMRGHHVLDELHMWKSIACNIWQHIHSILLFCVLPSSKACVYQFCLIIFHFIIIYSSLWLLVDAFCTHYILLLQNISNHNRRRNAKFLLMISAVCVSNLD